MAKLTYASIEHEIGEAFSWAQQQIQELADAYRAEKLLPFCRKHQLTYLAGMGRTVFTNKHGDTVTSTELKALKPIEDILNIDAIGRNDVFGYYIFDITEDDLVLAEAAEG